MLRVENLGKRFGSRWLFRHVEFEVGIGDCLVVTGSNGSGKSTLLKCLAKLARASEGTIHVPDKVGLVSLEIQLYPWLSAIEHLEFAAKMRGLTCDPTLLAEVGLPEAAWNNLPASKFSTGMKSRLRLAIAIQNEPDTLMLDEPGAGLDETGRTMIASVIAKQKKRGAVLIATNDPLEERFGTHALRLG